MIRRLFQIALAGLTLNTSHLLAIAHRLIEYDNASLAQAIFEDNDALALAIIKHKLYDYNYILDFIDVYWRHPFLDAIANGNTQEVAAMLKEGISFNDAQQCVFRHTLNGINLMEEEGAMQVAIKYSPNSYEMVKILLDAGMDSEQTFFSEKRQRGNEEGDLLYTSETPLSLANKYKKKELIALLLKSRSDSDMDRERSVKNLGYQSDVTDSYFRHPLIDALKKGKLNLVLEMINKGIDLNKVSQGIIRDYGNGQTNILEEEGALQIAIKYAPNPYEAVKLLLDNGLNPYQNSFKYVLREEYLKSDPQVSHIDLIDLALDFKKPDIVELLSQYKKH
jgi:ankyrin repeat protein